MGDDNKLLGCVSRDAFIDAAKESGIKQVFAKLTFDMNVGLRNDIGQMVDRVSFESNRRITQCEAEIKKIVKRKWYHIGASFIGGIVGGIGAVIANWRFLGK
jgi:hypothetical protein